MSLWFLYFSLHRCWLFGGGVWLALGLNCYSTAAESFAGLTTRLPAELRQLTEQHCGDCHSGSAAEAGLDLTTLSEQPVDDHFADWRQVRRVLAERSMPPDEGPALSERDRGRLLDGIGTALHRALAAHEDDPGPSVVRRLTSAEYDYCIEDLTGVSLHLGEQFVSDSVGGSGFTNSAAAQFMQDATLERYLEAARRVADHAMLGAGPLYFFESPGETGLELSAARRIQAIYRQHGFRTAAGEGAEPYGLQRFASAFEIAWQYRYRQALNMPNVSIEELASRANLEPKFAKHIWNVLQRTDAPFPLSDIIARWQQFPLPQQVDLLPAAERETHIAQQSQALYQQMQSWQTRLAGSASAEEEAAVLAEGHVEVPSQAHFVARALRKRKNGGKEFTPDLNNANLYSADGGVRFTIAVEAASQPSDSAAVVIFSKPQFRFRVADLVQPAPLPLINVLGDTAQLKLHWGQNPGGETIRPDELALEAGDTITLEIELPDDCRSGELLLDARLDRQLGRDCVVRCSVQDITDERGRSYSSLLRDPHSHSIDQWQAGLAEFAAALPQISHREAIPSDRDPIPAPYDNTYNLPERNFFHTAVKYHRDDGFLRSHLLPDDALLQLDLAWSDLLSSFDYHDVNVRFVCDKFGIERPADASLSLDAAWLSGVDEIPRQHIVRFLSEKRSLQADRQRAESVHLQNMYDFAARAWRRPLDESEVAELAAFYHQQRTDHQLPHAAAIRGCLTRILVSPAFLFRIETASHQQTSASSGAPASSEKAASPPEATPLSSHELASRLSFFLWSSLPDDELRRLADRHELTDAEVLKSQVRRMLKDAKSRRLATEFFGQWLGFYQFDRFRGVDTGRFPEFDETLKKSLYAEAIDLCAYIVQADRAYQQVLTADSTFVDQRAAEHYAIAWQDDWSSPHQIKAAGQFHRGGVLALGAILTSTSAPLRTSPVKRGDWILRRILGTPVPPPPADVGSIAAEEILTDGQTARQQLEAHRQQESCMGCHVRIDPLGFSLEHFDSLGRWRDTYGDGQAVDASGVLPNGRVLAGLDDLRSYLTESDELFRRTFATKLVAYCLGRAETVADAALIEQIMRCWESDPRFSTAVLAIVNSPQFRNLRSTDNGQ